jgi:hypothetical protein
MEKPLLEVARTSTLLFLSQAGDGHRVRNLVRWLLNGSAVGIGAPAMCPDGELV